MEGSLPCTFSNVAVVMVFAKLDCELDNDPDEDGDEATCAYLGHDLQHSNASKVTSIAINQHAEANFPKRDSMGIEKPSGCWAHCGHR